MSTDKRTVLVLDDDEINLMILNKGVVDAGYAVRAFSTGQEALDYLRAHPAEVDIALIDKMMPGMSGIELLQHIKADASLKHIPVIIQTGDAGVEQMREGIACGAYYYLTKPFHPEILTALLRAACNECSIREELFKQIEDNASIITLLQQGDFVLKTHDEARRICAILSQAAVYPEFVIVGLMELLSNAIEHGNLAIGYERKRECMMNGSWQQELDLRAQNPEYADRLVSLHFERTRSGLYLIINDQGAGFDWRCLADHTALLRLNEATGRGLAKMMVMLDNVQFIGNGSEVHCSIKLTAPAVNTPELPERRRQA